MKTVPWHAGDLLHKLRRLSRFTVKTLAKEAKLPTSVIRRLEQGTTKQADQHTIHKLAQVFGYSAGEFLDAIPDAAIKPPITGPIAGEEQRAGKKRRQAGR